MAKVAVASTGKNAQKRLKRPIAGSQPPPWAAMTLPGDGPPPPPHARLPDLRPGDRILVSAELEVTTDCQQPPGCAGTPYGYDPEVAFGLVLAASKTAATPDPAIAIPLAPPQVRAVTHERHHDVFVVDNAAFTVPPNGLPWSGPSFVNATFAAWHPQAQQGQVLIIGQNSPSGRPKGDMCGLSVARLRPGTLTQPTALRTERRHAPTIPVITSNPQKRVVYSKRLDNLKRREQLRIRAQVKTRSAHLGYKVRTTVDVFLSEGQTSTDPGNEAKRVCPDDDPQITRGNGKNTLPTDNPLSSSKVGVKRIVKDARVPLYVNVMVTTGDPDRRAGPGDALNIVPGGFLAVTRYPPGLAG
jgi:hypothetical protein